MTLLRRLALIVTVFALTVAGARPFPASVPLPDDFQPEGIAVGTGSTFYAGSLTSGDIYRGSLRSGAGAIFVDAPPGRIAVGLKVDEDQHRLWVAGGPTGHAYVYSTRDGSTLADLTLTTGPSLLNDVVVTKDGAYFTDSFNPVLYKVPIAPNGEIGTPQTITLTGPAAEMVPNGVNLNGIDGPRNGSFLIVGHSALSAVMTVDPRTGSSRDIAVTGGAITGAPDGILLDGKTLWVLENFAERLVKLELSPDLSSGEITATLTSDLFRVPTTLAEHGSLLAFVNGRFDVGFPPPFGPGAPPGTDFDVVQLQKP